MIKLLRNTVNLLIPWLLLPAMLIISYDTRRLFWGLYLEHYLLIIPLSIYVANKFRWNGWFVIVMANSLVLFLSTRPNAYDYSGIQWKSVISILIIAISFIKLKNIQYKISIKNVSPIYVYIFFILLLPLHVLIYKSYSAYSFQPLIILILFIIGSYGLRPSHKNKNIFLLIYFILLVFFMITNGKPIILLNFSNIKLSFNVQPFEYLFYITYYFIGLSWNQLKEFPIEKINNKIIYTAFILPILFLLLEPMIIILSRVLDDNLFPLIEFSSAPYMLPIGAFFAGLSFGRYGAIVFLIISFIRGFIISNNISYLTKFAILDIYYFQINLEKYFFILIGLIHSLTFSILGYKIGQNKFDKKKIQYLEKQLIDIINLKFIRMKYLTIENLEEWHRQHDEISKTIRKTMFVLLSYCSFCLLTLSSPDIALIAVDSNIPIPFAGNKVSFSLFLLIGPIILIGIVTYLYLFLYYFFSIKDREDTHPLPFIFNLDPGKLLSGIVFYFVPLVTLTFFAWKALPRPKEAYWLILLTLLYSASTLLFISKFKGYSTNNFLKKRQLYLFWFVLIIAYLQAYNFEHFLPNPGFTGYHLKTPFLYRVMNLYKADLNNHDLRGTELSGSELSYADFDGAILSNASLQSATLIGASFKGTDLTKANLSDSNLIDAKFIKSNLSNTMLYKANLENTIFENCNLSNVNLSNANFNNANLEKSDLKGARLNEVYNLTCSQLKKAINWEYTHRDEAMLCGKSSLVDKKKTDVSSLDPKQYFSRYIIKPIF